MKICRVCKVDASEMRKALSPGQYPLRTTEEYMADLAKIESNTKETIKHIHGVEHRCFLDDTEGRRRIFFSAHKNYIFDLLHTWVLGIILFFNVYFK